MNISRPLERRGSLLICVLVVLLVSGMLAMLGLRLVMATANSQLQRAKIQQAQELVQLGRLTLAKLAKLQPGDSQNQLAPIELSLVARPGAEPSPAQVTFQLADSASNQWRIVARYPYNQPGEVQATWQGTPGQ